VITEVQAGRTYLTRFSVFTSGTFPCFFPKHYQQLISCAAPSNRLALNALQECADLPARERDHDEGQPTWRYAAKEGDAINGRFVNGQFEADAVALREPYASDAILDPTPELRRQQETAFLACGRLSASPPARHVVPGPVGGFHSKSLRRLP
jgi:hypothetical protein